MSGLAQVLCEQGYQVSGSNLEENHRVRELRPLGIPVYLGHNPEHLPPEGTVVFSSAIPAENRELCAARQKHLRVIHRQDLLAELMNRRPSIGVAGTHGKTTTTAMIALLFERSGLDPTFLIGSPSRSLGGHAKWGSGTHLIAEVDESDGYFTGLKAQMAVITNIDRDHLNYYDNEAALERSFGRFLVGSDYAVLSADDPHTPGCSGGLAGCSPLASTPRPTCRRDGWSGRGCAPAAGCSFADGGWASWSWPCRGATTWPTPWPPWRWVTSTV